MPLRTWTITPELLAYNQEFFDSYDYHSIMLVVSVSVFLITTTIGVMPYKEVSELVQTNLTFLMMGIVYVSMLQNLAKNTFNLGYFRFTDETKMEFFMAIKAFIVIYVCLKTFNSKLFFDYDLVLLNTQL